MDCNCATTDSSLDTNGDGFNDALYTAWKAKFSNYGRIYDDDSDKYYVSHTGIQKAIDNTVIALYIKGVKYDKVPRLENCTLLNNFDTQNGSILLIKISNLGQSVIDFS